MHANAVWWLLLTGALAALPPLLYVAFSKGHNRYTRLVGITAFLAFDLILFGSFTRLTDSGLGCPDWPGCYGHANPLAASVPIDAAETAMPSGPVTEVKAWIEMIHRYFAMGLGLLIGLILALAWRHWQQVRQHIKTPPPWLATGLFVAVCVQGAFGAWTVTLKLQPIIVTLHLLGGMTVLALLTMLLSQGAHPSSDNSSSGWTEAFRPLHTHAVVALSFILMQIALGGWVSSNYAVLACPDFPQCQGHWWPDMQFGEAFVLWRPLGMTAGGELIPFASLVAIHWVHRLAALAVLAVVGSLAWRVMVRSRTLVQSQLHAQARRWAGQIMLLLVLQCATGIFNVIFGWPLLVAVLHSGGAALLVMMLTRFLTREQT